jgi:Stage II sporulation protein E (SpoIIE)
MSENPADVIEWHISETPAADTSCAEHEGIHMGPFATEEECRTVLASLKQIPQFRDGALEIHKKCRRREKRIRMRLPVQVARLSAADRSWAAHTVDISSLGARLAGFEEPCKLGDFLEIRCGQREAVFRVAWVGLPGTPTAGHIGVECLSPETNIWDLDLSSRTDDEPLFREIAIARAVQRKLLPREKPALRTLDYSGKCIQALTVGGDYYDFLDMGSGRVGFILADVAGKGVPAALLMANLQGNIHNRVSIDSGDLPRLLAAVNDHFYQHTEPQCYATLFFGCYDDNTRSLGYVNCGHSPPVLLRDSGAVERLQATATVLGLFGKWDCTLAEISMEPGDVLSMFTDGITETTSSQGKEFGEERLLEVLAQNRDLESNAMLGEVENAVREFRSSEQLQDDLSLVIARGR